MNGYCNRTGRVMVDGCSFNQFNPNYLDAIAMNEESGGGIGSTDE